MRSFATVAAIGLFAVGCGPAGDCADVCTTLLVDCELNAWASVDQCATGCDDELFRLPRRSDVLQCYRDAADACDVDGLWECRRQGDGAVLDDAG